jgi:alkanesulfonate monooxygenase SsuD/methylene tetrahydromethanopterin reductase-like flavin-dependent oxidoreductase (luciferase family)
MKLGSFYELQYPRPWEPDGERKLVQQALEQVELADRLSYDYVWAVEHHFLEEYAHCSAPEVFLAAASQRTKNIRIGHAVTLLPFPYNHPARVAERIAMLDLVSNGRLEFGSGESSSDVEMGGFGVSRADKREMWMEGLEAICRMFVEEPFQGFEGKYFKMPVRNVVPKPMQKPHPPLWVACSKPETIYLAARCGIGALSFAFVPPDEIKPWVDSYYKILEEECVPIGKAINPNIFFVNDLFCCKDERRARQIGDEAGAFFKYGVGHYYAFGEHQPGRTSVWEKFKTDKEHLGAATGFGSQTADGAAQSGNLIGTPKQIREVLLKYEALGADQVVLISQSGKTKHEDICESLELFAREVMPEFKDREHKRAREKAARMEPIIEKVMKRARPPRIAPTSGPTIIKAAGVL